MHIFVLTGHMLLTLEKLWSIAWFVIIILMNSWGGTAFTYEQAVFDCIIRVAAIVALAHLVRKFRYRKPGYWSYAFVLVVVTFISIRGFLRYWTFFNQPTGDLHGRFMTGIVWSAFFLSCLEILWLMAIGMVQGITARIMISIDTGSRRKEKIDYMDVDAPLLPNHSKSHGLK